MTTTYVIFRGTEGSTFERLCEVTAAGIIHTDKTNVACHVTDTGLLPLLQFLNGRGTIHDLSWTEESGVCYVVKRKGADGKVSMPK